MIRKNYFWFWLADYSEWFIGHTVHLLEKKGGEKSRNFQKN